MTAKGEAVRDAIEELFSDTSVDQSVTLDDLEEIESDISGKIEALKTDIKHKESGE
jgi:flagellar basal body-associated protein FliL